METAELEHLEKHIGKLQSQISRLRWVAAVLILIWIVSATWIAIRMSSVSPVLSVERLEIVEPDGKPAFVLANSQRPIAATIDGQPTMAGQEEERKGIPSIIFFDGKGDEVGGMLFGVREKARGC